MLVGLLMKGAATYQTLPMVFMSWSCQLYTLISWSIPSTKFIGTGSTTNALFAAPALAKAFF